MKILIILLLILVCVPLAYSETQVFSGTVTTGQDIVIAGGTFRFVYDEETNKTFVQMPSQNTIVENGKCSTNNLLKICVGSATYYDQNATTYENYYKLDVSIYKDSGSLTEESSSASYNLLQGEPANLTFTIKNPTNIDVNNIIFTQNLLSLQATNANGCTLSGSILSWSGSLAGNYNKVCSVSVMSQNNQTYNILGTLSYFDGLLVQNTSLEAISINVLPDQLSIDSSIDDAEIDEPFYLNVSLANINPTEVIDLKASIDIPRNFVILSKVEGFGQDEGNLRKDTKLDPGSVLNYSLYLKANAQSKIPIIQSFDYAIKGYDYRIQKDVFVQALEPKPIINITSEYNELVPGQKFIVVVSIKNPSKVHDLNSILAKLSIPGNNDLILKLDALKPGEQYPIISATMNVQKDFGASFVPLNLDLNYSYSGLPRSFSKSVEVKLKRANLTINKTSNGVAIQNLSNKSSLVSQKSNTSATDSKELLASKDKMKSLIFNKQALLVIGVVFITFFVVVFIILRSRKGKKPQTSVSDQELSQLSNEINNLNK